jgi:hypothetical protein
MQSANTESIADCCNMYVNELHRPGLVFECVFFFHQTLMQSQIYFFLIVLAMIMDSHFNTKHEYIGVSCLTCNCLHAILNHLNNE